MNKKNVNNLTKKEFAEKIGKGFNIWLGGTFGCHLRVSFLKELKSMAFPKNKDKLTSFLDSMFFLKNEYIKRLKLEAVKNHGKTVRFLIKTYYKYVDF